MTIAAFLEKFSDQIESKPMESSVNPPRVTFGPLTDEDEKEIFQIPQEIIDEL